MKNKYIPQILSAFACSLFLTSVSAQIPHPQPAYAWQKTDIDANLHWAPHTSAVAYDVYFGTTTVLDSSQYRGRQTATVYVPGTLEPDTPYYWRIDRVDSAGNVTTGSLWHFRTTSETPGANSMIDNLADSPSDYLLRDWEDVMQEYDSLVSDFTATGTYLPLVWWDTAQLNFEIDCPYIPSFVGMDKGGDALNLFPTVVGATLAGIDKSNVSGHDWVRSMMQFQGTSTGRKVIGNNKNKQRSTGLWYDVMPGVYFSQTVDLYPALASLQTDYSFQSGSASMEEVMYETADRWYDVLGFLGGSTTGIADFNGVVGFNTVTMEIDDRDGTHPGVLECAAGLAWIQYMAYVRFGDAKFLEGTQWALNFLDTVGRNPMHNGMQIGYGALTMARMNAELGFNYDIDQVFRWTFGEFDAGDPLRNGWGVLYGSYGAYEVSGLIGSEGQRDGANRAYAKQGYNLAASLVPMVRYDERYAFAVGKWMLHLASSSRHYYQTFLNSVSTDSPFFAGDPNGVIPFESLRGYHDQSYFEGYLDFLDDSPNPNLDVRDKVLDAIDNPPDMWASGRSGPVNGGLGLCMYFGGDVGYLGAIVKPTNRQKILQLDLLATDFFRDDAYPTYLYYNPWSTDKTIQIDAGPGNVKIYDTVSHNYILSDVSGVQTVNIPSKGARVLVLVPSSGTTSYSGRKMMSGGVVVDYNYPVKTRRFADGFESGDFTPGGWTTQNTIAQVKTEAAHTGSWGTKLYKTTWMEKSVSTAGYKSVYVKYRRETSGYTTGDNLYIEWSDDGVTWHNLETVQAAAYSDGLQNKSCGTAANNKPNFRIRFRTDANAAGKQAYIDDVEVVASY